jgi:Type VI secretion system effector, Hcp
LTQIPSVNGSVNFSKYRGWILLNSFSTGITTSTSQNTGGGGASGRPMCQPLVLIKPLDSTSPELAHWDSDDFGATDSNQFDAAIGGRGSGRHRHHGCRLPKRHGPIVLSRYLSILGSPRVEQSIRGVFLAARFTASFQHARNMPRLPQ